jgi:hypothetical protein
MYCSDNWVCVGGLVSVKISDSPHQLRQHKHSFFKNDLVLKLYVRLSIHPNTADITI